MSGLSGFIFSIICSYAFVEFEIVDYESNEISLNFTTYVLRDSIFVFRCV